MHTTRNDACPWGDGHIPSLDGWRAVSIILVLGSHSVRSVGFPDSWKSAATFLFDGSLGVRCFFIISGFLITTLLLRENWKTGRIHLSSFYIIRSLRIFPVYFTFVGFIALLEYFSIFDQPNQHWWKLLTFTSNYSTCGNWPTGHTWSLACEEQFYLLWPSLMTTLGLFVWKPAVQWLLLLPLILAPASRVFTYLDTFPDNPLFNLFSLLNYIDSLAIGCLLAYLHPALQRWFASPDGVWVLLLAVFAIITPHILGYLLILAPFTISFSPTSQALGLAVLISWTMQKPQSHVGQFLNLRPIVWLGALSYSIYIWQQFFFSQPAMFGWSSPALLRFPFCFIGVLASATCSYYFLEKPLLQLRKRLSNVCS